MSWRRSNPVAVCRDVRISILSATGLLRHSPRLASGFAPRNDNRILEKFSIFGIIKLRINQNKIYA